MFITFEGGEGAGKSTQARLLTDALNAAGIPALYTREPGGTPNAEALRDLLLDRTRSWTVTAEVLLHFAARIEHLEATIRPALARSVAVICDRFADSTMVYQGYGLGADRAVIAALTHQLPVLPGLTFILDLTAETAARRMASRRQALDRYEIMDSEFHRRVREGFLDIAHAEPSRCVVISAEAGVEAVHGLVWETLTARMPAAA